ncbi:MAG TPA: transcriptional regulator [Clostridiales bacterium]|nr:transcriptional regulator [Clostridiales bacterium]
MNKKDDFYYNVRRKLDERDMQQKELASLLGITPAFVSSILTGKCGRKARVTYIPKVANILGIAELPADVKKHISS